MNLEQITDVTIREMVEAALQEDDTNPDRENFGFDLEGFDNFFPEHTPDQIKEAWSFYRQMSKGQQVVNDPRFAIRHE